MQEVAQEMIANHEAARRKAARLLKRTATAAGATHLTGPALVAAKHWEGMPSLWSVAILISPWMGPPTCTAQVRGLDRSVAILISPCTEPPACTAQVRFSDSSQLIRTLDCTVSRM